MNIKNINIIYPLISIFMISLIIIFCLIAINLKPLMIWANYQNICIREESIDTSIPWAVRKCNGRSKVYQVK